MSADFSLTSRVLADARLSAVAAHGISPAVAATWAPDLVREARVLVPIQLDALVVPPGDTSTWADCRMKEPPPGSTETQPADARALLPEPFTVQAPRQPGVYLHWALPDALTHGVQKADAKHPDAPRTTDFPPVPDRWLVLRLGPAAGSSHRSVTGWVIENEGRNPVVTPVDSWHEPGRHADTLEPLTALGHGDPGWAAYYDNVEDRLAFHDSLADLKVGQVAYLVCGWYSDPAMDPLGASQVKTLLDFHARMGGLGWQLAAGEFEEAVRRNREFLAAAAQLGLDSPLRFSATAKLPTPPPTLMRVANLVAATSDADTPAYTTDGSWWPQQTLFHGCAVALGWPDDSWPGNEGGGLSIHAGGPPAQKDVGVALAGTVPEALGVVVARTTGTPDDARFVEAFTFDMLNELDRPDGRAHLDARLHAVGFGSMPGGETTEVIHEPAEPPAPPLPATPGTPGPGVFANRQGGLSGPIIDFTAGDLTIQSAASSVASFQSPLWRRETVLLDGNLMDVLDEVGAGGPPPPLPHPARDITVRRSLPRFFHPSDPVVLLQGARRSFKHGADGRFTPEGELVCRLSGFGVHSLTVRVDGASPLTIHGEDLLTRGVGNGGVPPECEELLREAVLLDPGSAASVSAAATASPVHAAIIAAPAALQGLVANTVVEQTVWWALRSPAVDPAPIVSRSGYSGQLPSPLAITPPQHPWVPLHLDWEAEIDLSGGGIDDWDLDEIDFLPGPPPAPADGGGATPPPPPPARVLKGRSLLTAGVTKAAADAARQALRAASASAGTGTIKAGLREAYRSEFHLAAYKAFASTVDSLQAKAEAAAPAGDGGGGSVISPAEQARLGSIAQVLDGMDVLATSLDGLDEQLRNGAPSIVDPARPAPAQPPAGMVALRSGMVRLLRLRLVDCFGQVVDLASSSDSTQADPTLIDVGETMAVSGKPGLGLLPPRFTAPARLWLRWIDAETDAGDGSALPVCSFVLPNHLDGALELFDRDGGALGTVRPDDTAGVAWEDAPGRPATVGQALSLAVPNARARGIVRGLLDWGLADVADPTREPALAALLRVIDSTLWSVDPFGHIGEEHLSLLIGHPVVVMRALVRLEVSDPVNPPQNAWTAVPLRVGALTHWSDGVLGFFVDDDYSALHCAQAAAQMARQVGPHRGFLGPIAQVPAYAAQMGAGLGGPDGFASPVSHPYLDPSDLIWIRPNQDVKLTLLVEPHTSVHATTGLLPRKEIGMRREWVAKALAALAPTFRFGPALVDPKTIRLPVPRDINGSWSWDHRTDTVTWADEAVVNARGDAKLGQDPAEATEGWLKLSPPPPGQAGGENA